MRFIRTFVYLFFLISGLSADEKLDTVVSGLFSHADYKDSVWSCSLLDLSTGVIYYDYNGRKRLTPASNQKLYVYAAAVDGLGLDYRPQMEVYRQGVLKNGILRGNLVIRGNGAVVFGQRQFSEKQIIENPFKLLFDKLDGLKAITGDIILDSAKWLQVNDHYPAANAFLINENTLELIVKDQKLRYIPQYYDPFKIESSILPVAQKRIASTIYVNKTIDSNDYWRINAEMKNQFFYKNLLNEFTENNVRVVGTKIELDDAPELLFTLKGLRVKDLLKGVGTHSDNLRAELLFLYFSHKADLNVNYANSRKLMMKQLVKYNFQGYSADCGSGLSYKNQVRTTETVRLISELYSKDSRFLKAFLAKPGEPGTLEKSLLKQKGRLWAKTGTLKDVKALSGIMITAKGRKLAFSIICNRGPGSKRCWQTIESLINQLDKE